MIAHKNINHVLGPGSLKVIFILEINLSASWQNCYKHHVVKRGNCFWIHLFHVKRSSKSEQSALKPTRYLIFGTFSSTIICAHTPTLCCVIDVLCIPQHNNIYLCTIRTWRTMKTLLVSLALAACNSTTVIMARLAQSKRSKQNAFIILLANIFLPNLHVFLLFWAEQVVPWIVATAFLNTV